MDRFQGILNTLSEEDNLRSLRSGIPGGKYIDYGGRRYVNMSSNDYLGLAGDTDMQRRFLAEMAGSGEFLMSSSASRLMTGNSPVNDALEESIAVLYPGKSALILGNGYMVNSGCLPALVGKRDLVVADKLVHASLIDGLRLCDCDWTRFNHNDMDQLETLLKKRRSEYEEVWVVTESVFSMDGDLVPLAGLVELKKRYGLRLYVDEAHAFGVLGPNGSGYAASIGCDRDIDVIVGTFGKALASYGAFAALDPVMRDVLINRMRTVIFSTGLPPIVMSWTKWLVDRLPEFEPRRHHLRELIDALVPDNPAATHIVPVPAGENAAAVAMSDKFRECGFWTTPIRWPTVPKGRARVRVSLTAAMDMTDIEKFKEIWNSIG